MRSAGWKKCARVHVGEEPSVTFGRLLISWTQNDRLSRWENAQNYIFTRGRSRFVGSQPDLKCSGMDGLLHV